MELTCLAASPLSSPAATYCLISRHPMIASSNRQMRCKIERQMLLEQHASEFRSELIAVALLLALALCCLDANFFVILLERREILTRLRELTLLHAFSDIPVHKGTLRVRQVELVVDAREDFG